MRHFDLHSRHGNHLLVRIDPRIKLVTALVLLVMVLSCRGTAFPLAMAALCLGLCLHLGVGPRQMLTRFAQPLLIAGMVLLLKFFCSGQIPLFSWSFLGMSLTGHADGLREGLLIAARIMGAVAVVGLVGFATSFTDMMSALAWLRVPRSLIDVALIAWRYLFILFDDAMVVYHAQKNRLGYAGYRRGLRSFGTLTGALMIKAFDNSQTITTAMVQRGYDGTMPLVRHKPFRAVEVIGSCTVVVAIGLIWQVL